jgi:hypothetical protein
MKQTAVEWLVSEYINKGVITIEAIEQAQAMEKQQLCYFYVKGAEAEINNPYISNIEFYNKNFKSE